jgi:predicted methyltransferase
MYHELYWVDSKRIWPQIYLNGVVDQLARPLRPAGVLLLAGHSARAGTGSADASRLHRIKEAQAIKEFNGLKV